MSPPRNGDPLYDLLQAVRTELVGRMDKHGQQLIALQKALEQHDDQDQAVENRVLRIEIERSLEKESVEKARTADRRISAVIAGAASMIWQIGKEAWNFYHPSAG